MAPVSILYGGPYSTCVIEYRLPEAYEPAFNLYGGPYRMCLI